MNGIITQGNTDFQLDSALIERLLSETESGREARASFRMLLGIDSDDDDDTQEN